MFFTGNTRLIHIFKFNNKVFSLSFHVSCMQKMHWNSSQHAININNAVVANKCMQFNLGWKSEGQMFVTKIK